MKAMILAAGLGTRLRPLTDTCPKALVEINGRTLLEITLTRLRTFGITEVIINVHHLAGQIIDYLHSKNNFNLRIEISREDDLLLDTGGGLKKASWFFLEDPNLLDEPFLLHNVDVLTTIDFTQMLQFHKDHQALATLAVQSRPSSRQLLFNESLQLRARQPISERQGTASAVPKNEKNVGASAPEAALLPLAFSGIHLLSPRLLPLLSEAGPFSIIDSYLRLASQSHPILAFRADEYYWRDLGRPSDLAQAAEDMKQGALEQ
jgi:NDP-sugar pyrophosphorylase family protein